MFKNIRNTTLAGKIFLFNSILPLFILLLGEFNPITSSIALLWIGVGFIGYIVWWRHKPSHTKSTVYAWIASILIGFMWSLLVGVGGMLYFALSN